MICGQPVVYSGTTKNKDEKGRGSIVAWMQGNGPYVIIETMQGRFVTATPEQLVIDRDPR